MSTPTAGAWRPRRVAVLAALLLALGIGGPFSDCGNDDEFLPPGPGAAP
jgi:hypothetical protein